MHNQTDDSQVILVTMSYNIKQQMCRAISTSDGHNIPLTVLSFIAQHTGVTAEIVITFQDTSGTKTERKIMIFEFSDFLQFYLFLVVLIHYS